MSSSFIENFRNRPREEWLDMVREGWTQARIWIQEHGEFAAVGGLVLGLVAAYFFKLFMMIVVIAVLTAAGIWYLAPTAEELAKRQSSGVSVNGHSSSSDPSSEKRGSDQGQ